MLLLLLLLLLLPLPLLPLLLPTCILRARARECDNNVCATPSTSTRTKAGAEIARSGLYTKAFQSHLFFFLSSLWAGKQNAAPLSLSLSLMQYVRVYVFYI